MLWIMASNDVVFILTLKIIICQEICRVWQRKLRWWLWCYDQSSSCFQMRGHTCAMNMKNYQDSDYPVKMPSAAIFIFFITPCGYPWLFQYTCLEVSRNAYVAQMAQIMHRKPALVNDGNKYVNITLRKREILI